MRMKTHLTPALSEAEPKHRTPDAAAKRVAHSTSRRVRSAAVHRRCRNEYWIGCNGFAFQAIYSIQKTSDAP
jgi:hypothetical protein